MVKSVMPCFAVKAPGEIRLLNSRLNLSGFPSTLLLKAQLLFLFVAFFWGGRGVTPGEAQGLLLALHSGNTEWGGPDGMLGMELGQPHAR